MFLSGKVLNQYLVLKNSDGQCDFVAHRLEECHLTLEAGWNTGVRVPRCNGGSPPEDGILSRIKGKARRKSASGPQPRSGVFQSEVVIYRVAEVLLAAEIALSRLNRRVAKQKLNLLKLTSRQIA